MCIYQIIKGNAAEVIQHYTNNNYALISNDKSTQFFINNQNKTFFGIHNEDLNGYIDFLIENEQNQEVKTFKVKS